MGESCFRLVLRLDRFNASKKLGTIERREPQREGVPSSRWDKQEMLKI